MDINNNMIYELQPNTIINTQIKLFLKAARTKIQPPFVRDISSTLKEEEEKKSSLRCSNELSSH